MTKVSVNKTKEAIMNNTPLQQMIKPFLLLVLCLITILSLFYSSISVAQNPNHKLVTDAAKREVVLENEQVQVVRLTYPAGTESGMHTHSFAHRVVYFVKGGTLSLIPQDTSKASKILVATDGETLFLPATTHNVKNIGDTEIIIVETELK